ncbi:hypothetical protein GPY51_22270 [Photorhabdus laumondii subsp. laumondii]|uniref:Uncharacterized protein n=1 Tax=Photorhabdus laumondii subsp. laumondii TaxID=141679 RepID=A0A6L9JUD7_PHOLM|nr:MULTISPECIES: hypothetical protein [Photorhabdus]MCC8386493.1 hypothetical protein [Photorhabdus laumondii]MCC8415332.1 hypothetical protein [Photorhabdus laumondii]NDK97031.1 hypothetical protein [Photorhabdus laumondii subsp. laumondii]NDL23245.1 hypothetical protein [Photorhabdus laumondii subsp. laumondii]NDL32223.1 hypothetical protein [Photorhabdus laumondii subsp. laumondii]
MFDIVFVGFCASPHPCPCVVVLYNASIPENQTSPACPSPVAPHIALTQSDQTVPAGFSLGVPSAQTASVVVVAGIGTPEHPDVSGSPGLVESPRGTSPQGAHGTGRERLRSSGSSH